MLLHARREAHRASAGGLLEEVVRQDADVLAPRAQGREVDGDHAEAVVEIPIHLPPLRARGEDIGILAHHFLEQASGGRPMRFASGVEEHLAAQSWDGNVRELQNAIERAVALSDGDVLRREDFVVGAQGASAHMGLVGAHGTGEGWLRHVVEQQMPLRELRDRVIVETVRACKGNMAEAARRLGIARPTLYRSWQAIEGRGIEGEEE